MGRSSCSSMHFSANGVGKYCLNRGLNNVGWVERLKRTRINEGSFAFQQHHFIGRHGETQHPIWKEVFSLFSTLI